MCQILDLLLLNKSFNPSLCDFFFFFALEHEIYLRERDRLTSKEESKTRKMGAMGIGRIRERLVQRQPRDLGANKWFAQFCILRLAWRLRTWTLGVFLQGSLLSNTGRSERLPLTEDRAQCRDVQEVIYYRLSPGLHDEWPYQTAFPTDTILDRR